MSGRCVADGKGEEGADDREEPEAEESTGTRVVLSESLGRRLPSSSACVSSRPPNGESGMVCNTPRPAGRGKRRVVWNVPS